MAILHKNISAEGDIHNPKWFSGANNGDVAWRNELGVLESTDELVLPAALDFVDGSAAPPTSNSGDIYVLSSGASVNAGWGTVALGDWVRYDGTTWNDITPQKSTLCYNETLDALISYTGSSWVAIGGDSIYTADGTIGAGRVATLTDSLIIKTASSTQGFKIGYSYSTENAFYVSGYGSGYWMDESSGYIAIGERLNKTHTRFTNDGFDIYENAVRKFRFQSGGNELINLFEDGSINGTGSHFVINSNAVIGTEKISLQSSTAIKGIGTAGSSALAIYDNDTTPVKVFEVLDDSTIKTNGNTGFTGTGAYTNFTIENGIITNAT